MRDENYYTIKGWMINKLGLKGTQLSLYAIIYGFSQDGASVFRGSVKYLAEFCNVTENSARMNLRELENRGLIVITSESGQVNSYSARLTDEPIEKPVSRIKAAQAKKESLRPSIEEVVDYLNKKTGRRFRPTTSEVERPIMLRLREGFTVEDCKKVIDVKCEEWLGDEKMSKYLRPKTLFGGNFQSYLNQQPAPVKETSYDLDKYKQVIMKTPRYHK